MSETEQVEKTEEEIKQDAVNNDNVKQLEEKYEKLVEKFNLFIEQQEETYKVIMNNGDIYDERFEKLENGLTEIANSLKDHAGHINNLNEFLANNVHKWENNNEKDRRQTSRMTMKPRG